MYIDIYVLLCQKWFRYPLSVLLVILQGLVVKDYFLNWSETNHLYVYVFLYLICSALNDQKVKKWKVDFVVVVALFAERWNAPEIKT